MRKVLILSGEFPPFAGGIAIAAANLAKALSQQGCSVTVIAPRYKGQDLTWDRQQPYCLVRLPFLRLRYVRMVPMTPVLLALAARERPDSVIAMRVTREGLPAAVMKSLLKTPFIVFAHALEFLRFPPHSLGWRVCRWVYEQAQAVAAVSSTTKLLLTQRGIPAEKVHTVWWGVNEDAFAPVPPLNNWNGTSFSGRKVLLTVGRLVPRKGVDKVLEALPTVIAQHPEVLYVVVGDGPYRLTLQKLAEQLGVADHVLFTGRVPDVRPFYHACDIFVMPTREEGRGDVEGLGLVYLEAAACGKPVIASAVGGAADTVVPETTGLFVDPLNPQDIAQAILRLLNDPNLAWRLGKAGRERILSEFTWEQTAKKVLALMTPLGD